MNIILFDRLEVIKKRAHKCSGVMDYEVARIEEAHVCGGSTMRLD